LRITANSKQGVIEAFLVALANAVVSALVREFGMAEEFARQVASAAEGSINVARWMAKNGVNESNLGEMTEILKEFNSLKPRLKARGATTDLMSLDYEGLFSLVESGRDMPPTISEIRKNLPREIIGIVTYGLGIAQRLNPQVDMNVAKPLAFQWVHHLFDEAVRRPWPGPDEWAIERLTEDKREIADAMGEYFAYVMGKPRARNILDFDTHPSLAHYVDGLMTPEQRRLKYSIDEPKTDVGMEIIALPDGYRAIRVTKWSERFRDELCKSARWCIRSPEMFESYNISEHTPLYLLLEGNRQVGLLSLALGEFKDVMDAPIGESKMLKEDELDKIFDVVESLADVEGVDMPAGGDFLPWMITRGKIPPRALLDMKEELEELKSWGREEGQAAVIDSKEDSMNSLMRTYAQKYLEIVEKSDLDPSEVMQILQEITNHAPLSIGRLSNETINNLRAVGRIAKKIAVKGRFYRPRLSTPGALSLFRRFLPEEYLEWARTVTPASNQTLDLTRYLVVMSHLTNRGRDDDADQIDEKYFGTIPEDARKAVLAKAQQEFVSHPAVLSEEEPVLPGVAIYNNGPTDEGETILRDGDDWYLTSDSWDLDNLRSPIGAQPKLVASTAKFVSLLGSYRKKMFETTRTDMRRASQGSMTPEEAEEMFKKHAGRERWDYRRRDFEDPFKATDMDAQNAFFDDMRDIGRYLDKDSGIRRRIENLPKEMNYADFAWRLVNWAPGGSVAPFLGQVFEEKIRDRIDLLKRKGNPIEEKPPPKALVAWIDRSCKWA